MLPGAQLVHRRIYIKAEINPICLTGSLNLHVCCARRVMLRVTVCISSPLLGPSGLSDTELQPHEINFLVALARRDAVL